MLLMEEDLKQKQSATPLEQILREDEWKQRNDQTLLEKMHAENRRKHLEAVDRCIEAHMKWKKDSEKNAN